MHVTDRPKPLWTMAWVERSSGWLQAIKALKQTVEECWDHDAEARISAVCVDERTRELSSLWETRLKGRVEWLSEVLRDF